MRFHALACDFDGTLATDGRVPERVLAALEQLKQSGRQLILVTGRRLDETLQQFPGAALFSLMVLENGAVLHRPSSGEQVALSRPPPEEFVARLRRRGVSPLELGRVVVATTRPHEGAALDVIRDLGLELHVVFNKGAVMILPSGVTKASGLEAALRELKLSPHNVVGVGDAENDHAFLEYCECGVAVQNALPALKEKADWVTSGSEGEGVLELCRRLLSDDLAAVEPRLKRREILLGESLDGGAVAIPPHGVGMLIVGPSGGGKSTLTTGILERLREAKYQVCVIDPEGDYQGLDGIASLGGRDRVPSVQEALDVLEVPDQNLALNLLGIPLESRPEYLQQLMPALMSAQGRTGRPHWIVIDEAHHVYPSAGPSAGWRITKRPEALLVVTLELKHLAPDLRSWIDLAILLGPDAPAELNRLLALLGLPPASVPRAPSAPGEALAWWKRRPGETTLFRGLPSSAQRRRHERKYAEGDLGPERSFVFRGPEGKLNLRAQNLIVFLQMADGVDEETWRFHLQRGEVSAWFREAIKDPGLADQAREIEADASLPAADSRARIRKLIESQYTLPA